MLRSSLRIGGLVVMGCVFTQAVSAQALEPAAVAPPAATPTHEAPVETPAPVVPEATAAPAAPAASAAPTHTIAEPPPSAAMPASCIIGASPGIPEADAMTAAGLVCEALLQAGARIDATPLPASEVAGNSAYRVSLHPLGKLLLLKVGFESPIGATTDSRTMQLGKIEEVPVAATRIAESFVKGTDLADTAHVDTLVGQETRAYDKKQGEFSVGVGVFGFGAFNSDVLAGYGISGKLYYEVPRYGVGGEVRLGGSDEGSGDATLTSVGLSGRYFFADGDITPFLGGGFGLMWFSDRSDLDGARAPSDYTYYDDYVTHEGSGIGTHFDAGVEFLRMHDVRFDVLLRVDTPLFTLTEFNGDDRYVLPVSLMASFSFQ